MKAEGVEVLSDNKRTSISRRSRTLGTARHLVIALCATVCTATAFAETRGPPVLFPRGAFDLLEKLTGDDGARAVLSDPRFTVHTVRFEDAAIDVDTPDDFAALSDRFLQ